MSNLSTLQKCVVVAMCLFAGLFLYWRIGAGAGSIRSLETKSLTNVHTLATACRRFASDNHGKFPPSLDALFPAYLTNRSQLASPLKPDEPAGYIYTAGLTNTGPVNAVIIEDKFGPSQHVRIVAYVDGSARILDTP